MADRSPAPDRSPDEPDAAPRSRSLTERWWWQAAVLIIAGGAVIGFQWDVLANGEPIAATWAMVVIGAGVIVFGAVVAWRTRPRQEEPHDD